MDLFLASIIINTMQEDEYYILGWLQPSGKVAVLCRSRGSNPGPAFCWSKREAIQLRTKLANDKRGEQNPTARRIIRQLLVYKYLLNQPLHWRPGDIWVYVEPRYLEPCEVRHAV
jgi:hypothetical protein